MSGTQKQLACHDRRQRFAVLSKIGQNELAVVPTNDHSAAAAGVVNCSSAKRV